MNRVYTRKIDQRFRTIQDFGLERRILLERILGSKWTDLLDFQEKREREK